MAVGHERQQKLRIADAHQHFWDPIRNYYPWLCDPDPIPFRYGDYTSLRRPYLPSDYRLDAKDFDVVKSVYVEAEWDPENPIEETRWVQTVAAEHGLPSAMVAQAWLHHDDAEDILAQQAGAAIVRGVRHKPRSAASPSEARRGEKASMDDPAWRRGYAALERYGLSFDLQTPWWHLDAAAELARDFPRTQIVINHTGLPADRSPEGLAGWRDGLATAAAEPNVAIKISGLGRPGLPWTVEANGPIVRQTLSIFGVQRCMFASNFPVDSLVGSFGEIFSAFSEICADRPDAERQALFHDNAVRIYRL